MKENDPLEQQLQSWTPRRPSPKIATRLFGRDARALVHTRHVWNWLTPAIACGLTLLIAATHPASRVADVTPASTGAFASFAYDSESPNMPPHSFVLSRLGQNVDANSFAHPYHPSLNSSNPVPGTNRSTFEL